MFVGFCWVETADVHMTIENDKQVGKKIGHLQMKVSINIVSQIGSKHRSVH